MTAMPPRENPVKYSAVDLEFNKTVCLELVGWPFWALKRTFPTGSAENAPLIILPPDF